MLAKGRRKRNRTTGLYVTLVLAVAMLIGGAQTVFGAEAVTYLNSKGEEKTVTNYTEVTSNTDAWGSGWYVLKQSVAVDNRIEVSGDVHVILQDGATLTAANGIHLGEGNSLSVYSQSIGDEMGGITAYISNPVERIGNSTSNNRWSPIGSSQRWLGGSDWTESEDSGELTINGGEIKAGYVYHPNRDNRQNGSAGIGGCLYSGSGLITVNNGRVSAIGGQMAAGIGGGNYGTGCMVVINGGEVVAEGGSVASGIGTARYDTSGKVNIEINGGKVTANAPGSYHDAVNASIGGEGGTIAINGGEVYANSDGKGILSNTEYSNKGAAGIGGGRNGVYCNVTIKGGKVEATSSGVGIGGNDGNGGTTTIKLKRDVEKNIYDSLTASSFNGIVRTQNPVKYQDAENNWKSMNAKTLDNDDKAAIAGREVLFMGKDPRITVGVVGDDDRAERARKELDFKDKEGNPEPHLTLVKGEENAIQLSVDADSDADITLTSGGVNPRFEFDKNWKIWGGNTGTTGYFGWPMRFKTEETDEYEAGEYRIGYRVPGNDPVKYLDAKGKERVCTEHYPIGAQANIDTFYDGFYVTDMSKKTLSNRVDIMGDTHIILRDGHEVTSTGNSANENIAGLHVPENSSLTFYSQSLGDNMGKYTVSVGGSMNACIGSDRTDPVETVGDITINGGKITATNSNQNGDPAAIGSAMASPAGNITINNGTVVAESGMGAGIGSGSNGTAGMIEINGGDVTGTSRSYGAGIGGGRYMHGGTIIINGGTIKGYGSPRVSGTSLHNSAGIGGEGANITINGGSVYGECGTGFMSNSYRGAGIGGGGGNYGGVCNIDITGGKVEGKGYSTGIGPAGDGANSSIKLAWKEETDSIKNTKGITGSVSAVKNFKYKNDNGETVTLRKGQLSSETLSAILNREITPDGTAQTVKIKDSTGKDITGTEVNKTTAELSFDITTEVTPSGGGEVTYDVDDTSIATIGKNGRVHIEKAGTTVIRASVSGTGEYYEAEASFTLNVARSDQNIAFTKPAGGTATTVKATDADYNVEIWQQGDGGNVTYRSSDESIAAIDATSGKVTPKKAGKVTITATAAETDKYNAKSVTFELTVERAPRYIRFTNNNLNPTEAGLVTHEQAPYYYTYYADQYDEANKKLTGQVKWKIDTNEYFDFEEYGNNGVKAKFKVAFSRSMENKPKTKFTAYVDANDKYEAAELSFYLVTVKYNSAVVVEVNNDDGTTKVLEKGETITRKTSDESFNCTFRDALVNNNEANQLDPDYIETSSEDPEVATMSNDGKVTLTGKSGETKITVDFKGTAVRDASSTYFTVKVEKDDQTVAFEKDEEIMNCGDEEKVIAATNNRTDGGDITYALAEGSDPDVATVDETTGKVTVGKAGTVTITAQAAGTDKYNESAKTSYDLTVEKADHTLTFEGGVENGKLEKTYGDEVFTTVAQTDKPELAAKEGYTVAYASSNDKVATVDDTGKVTLHSAGEAVITAAAWSKDYLKETTASYTLTVKKGTQTITLVDGDNNVIENGSTVERKTGDTLQIVGELNVTDGGSVKYESSDEDVAFYRTDGKIVIVDIGEALMTVTALGNDKYEEAVATFTLKIEQATPNELKDQKVTFDTVSGDTLTKYEGDPDFTSTASTTGDGEITYSSSNEEVAIISSTGRVHINGIGETTIEAVASATEEYKGAKATYKLIVEPVQLGEQIVRFEGVDGDMVMKKITDDDFSTPASSNVEGATITYRSDDENVAVAKQDGEILIEGIGQATITATAEAEGYSDATASYLLVVGKGDQKITFRQIDGDALNKTTVDEAFDSSAESTGDGEISYRSGNEDVAMIDVKTGKVTIIGAGTATITATAGETATYAEGSASYLLNVSKADQTVSFKNIQGETLKKKKGEGAFDSSATSTGDGEITYESGNTEVATVDTNGTVTIRGEGTATITATAAETDKFAESFASYILTVEDPYKQMGVDGTPLGAGASAEAADRAITSMKKDTDPRGSVYRVLKLKSTKQGKTSVKVQWAKAKGATKYVVYGNACGSKYKMTKLATTGGSSKSFSKIAGKKVKKANYYKFIVVALDKNNNVVSTSKMVHAATKGGKAGNHKSVSVKIKKGKKYKKVSKVSVKVGKTQKLKVKLNKAGKKTKVKKHVGTRYETSNANVATISGGKIKGKGKGTCTVYVYAQNGVAKAIKVTVK